MSVLYSAFVAVELYTILCYTGPWLNSARFWLPSTTEEYYLSVSLQQQCNNKNKVSSHTCVKQWTWKNSKIEKKQRKKRKTSKITKILELTLIKHWSQVKVSDQNLIDVVARVSVLQDGKCIALEELSQTRVPATTLRLRQNGSHFADNIFKCIFLELIYFWYFDHNFTKVCSWGSNWQ